MPENVKGSGDFLSNVAPKWAIKCMEIIKQCLANCPFYSQNCLAGIFISSYSIRFFLLHMGFWVGVLVFYRLSNFISNMDQANTVHQKDGLSKKGGEERYTYHSLTLHLYLYLYMIFGKANFESINLIVSVRTIWIAK